MLELGARSIELGHLRRASFRAASRACATSTPETTPWSWRSRRELERLLVGVDVRVEQLAPARRRPAAGSSRSRARRAARAGPSRGRRRSPAPLATVDSTVAADAAPDVHLVGRRRPRAGTWSPCRRGAPGSAEVRRRGAWDRVTAGATASVGKKSAARAARDGARARGTAPRPARSSGWRRRPAPRARSSSRIAEDLPPLRSRARPAVAAAAAGLPAPPRRSRRSRRRGRLLEARGGTGADGRW